MKLKGLHFADVAEIQVAVIDELKKAQKRNFRQIFGNCTTPQKREYMSMELILNKNKVWAFITYLRFLKKFCPKTFEPHCVYMRAASKIVFSICVG